MRRSILIPSALAVALFSVLGAGPNSPHNLLEKQFGSVSGKVIGVDGSPAASAIVRLMGSNVQSGSLPNDPVGKSWDRIPTPVEYGRGESVVAFAKADANGLFKMPKVPVGKYRIAVSVPKTKVSNASVSIEAGKEATIDIKLEAKS